MENESKILKVRIESYLKTQGIDLSEDQKTSVFNGVQFWFNYVIDDAISDAVSGVTFEEVL